MAPEQRCPSDLTDGQWAVLAPDGPPAKPGGRPRTVAMRGVVNAIVQVDRTGCQWRSRPAEYPNWQTVYWSFIRFQDEGAWERIRAALRRAGRQRAGRDPEPSAAMLDRQSVKTSHRGARAAPPPPSR